MVKTVALSKKWIVLLHIGIVVLALLVVVGLRVLWVPKEPPREASGVTVNYPFMLTITTQKNNYRQYETVNIQIALRNIGNETVTIMFMHYGNPSKLWFQFVYDESGRVVFYWNGVGLLPMVDVMTLQPNESREISCTWDQKNTDTGIQVPLGFYYLTAAVGFILGEDFNGTVVNLESQKRIAISTF